MKAGSSSAEHGKENVVQQAGMQGKVYKSRAMQGWVAGGKQESREKQSASMQAWVGRSIKQVRER